MKKKPKEEVLPEITEEAIEEVLNEEPEEAPVEVEKKKVMPLDIDFGREDLNKLRDKVNELIN